MDKATVSIFIEAPCGTSFDILYINTQSETSGSRERGIWVIKKVLDSQSLCTISRSLNLRNFWLVHIFVSTDVNNLLILALLGVCEVVSHCDLIRIFFVTRD